jgi:hypothetical protein
MDKGRGKAAMIEARRLREETKLHARMRREGWTSMEERKKSKDRMSDEGVEISGHTDLERIEVHLEHEKHQVISREVSVSEMNSK